MDYAGVIEWLHRHEGRRVGVLVGASERDELPQAVMGGVLRRDPEGGLIAGITILGAEEAVMYTVGDHTHGFSVVRSLLDDASAAGQGGQALRIVQEGVAVTIWPDPESE